MNPSPAVAQQFSALANYTEPIHIPGSIQPHGLLFALKTPEFEILQISENTVELLGIEPEQLLGKSLSHLIGEQQLSSLTRCLSEDFEFENINPLKITVNIQNKTLFFDGILHRLSDVLILELEPITSSQIASFFDFYYAVKGPVDKLQKASDLTDLCQAAAKEIRQLTECDRVMVYQFDPEGAGTVIAEEKIDDLTPYLGLRYPALDIPSQARHLFTLNRLRLIPDAHYQPVNLVPTHHPLTHEPLDLSFAVLRSVSPCHLEYLHNMGIRASMSISLIKDQQLWGLIACHHQTPKFLTYETRTVCEFLGKVISLELASKEANEDLEYKMKLKSIQSQFVESIPEAADFVSSLVKNSAILLDLVSAQGAAIYFDGELTMIGKVPTELNIQKLIEWVEPQIKNDIFCTESLPKVYPMSESDQKNACGLLALSLSKVQKNYIFWFRPEVIQTVNWGGDPHQPVEFIQDGKLHLSPRTSFELWQETVQLRSLPWKPCEIDAVLELRSAIIGIALRKADELAKINVELERSNSELDAFAYIASHDLKEPLRGIHNYSNFLIEDYAEVLTEDGVSKLQTLVRLTQRMENLIDSLLHFSRLGRVELAMRWTDLNDLVAHVIDVLKISLKETTVDICIPRPLPMVECDRIQVNEVFSNLISNAIKYNDKPDKWVEIGFLDPDSTNKPETSATESQPQQPIVFYVRDNGIGIREKHLDAIFRIFKRLHAANKYGGGTGAGLTITKKIVERHGGEIWVESNYGQGSTFYFTLQS